MDMNPASARIFSAVLEERTGQKIVAGRRWRIEVALAAVMREHGLASLDQVAARLDHGRDGPLADTVVEALLNHETSFFRDPAAFDLFAGTTLAALIERNAQRRRLRMWCAGCSTGQEAYSLAMLLAEDERLAGWHIDILATDVSQAAIAKAQQGLYTQFEIQRGLPIRRMLRWFEQVDDGWRALAALRARVRFRQHSLLEAAPAPRGIDVIFCRNVLLYFAGAVRTRVFDRLAEAIAADGVLMLGAGETVIGQTTRFLSDPAARGLYRPAGD